MGWGTFILGGIVGFVIAGYVPVHVETTIKDQQIWKTLGQVLLELTMRGLDAALANMKGVN